MPLDFWFPLEVHYVCLCSQFDLLLPPECQSAPAQLLYPQCPWGGTLAAVSLFLGSTSDLNDREHCCASTHSYTHASVEFLEIK